MLFLAAVLPHGAFAQAATTPLSGRFTTLRRSPSAAARLFTPAPVAAGAAGAGGLRTSTGASGEFTHNAVPGG
jgi:hypothetical protein